jgi:hypothetical protein
VAQEVVAQVAHHLLVGFYRLLAVAVGKVMVVLQGEMETARAVLLEIVMSVGQVPMQLLGVVTERNGMWQHRLTALEILMVLVKMVKVVQCLTAADNPVVVELAGLFIFNG